MILVLLISSVAAATNFSIALLALSFSRAPGWHFYRIFAVLAFLIGVYALNDALFLHRMEERSATVMAGRVNLLIAVAVAALYLVFSNLQLGQRISKLERGVVALMLMTIAVGLIPGVATSGVESLEVESLDLHYFTPEMTLFGMAMMFAATGSLLFVALRYLRAAWVGTIGARVSAFGFCLLALFATEELVVALGFLDWPYLADLGFAGLTITVAVDMSERVFADSKALSNHHQSLASRVQASSEEHAQVHEALLVAARQAALGQLAAGVGHEINNPLAYLSANLIYLRDEHEERAWKDDELEAIEEAIAGVQRISDIVRDLMVGTQRVVRGNARADLHGVVNTAVRMAKAPFGSSVHFVVEGNKEEVEWPQVRIDEGKLVQVVLNLLINAAQASTSENEDTPTVRVRFERREEEVWLQVVDEGSGITPEDLGRIFDPLYTTKEVGEGTGLGLFVSKGIIELAGGRLIAESEAGKGATLSVVLMLAPAVSEKRPDPASTPMRKTLPAELSLYIIDDEALVTRAIARMLRGTSIVAEKDSRQALTHLSDGADYDVIICDLMMPGLSGVELYERILEKRPELAARFLFLTGGATTSGAEELLQTPGVSFLYKPVEREELVATIKRIANAHS